MSIPPPQTNSRHAAVELDSSVPDLEGRWARFLDAVRRQPAEVFQAPWADPRWVPTTTGEPPYIPGADPVLEALPRRSASAPVRDEWWDAQMQVRDLWDDS